MNSRSQITQPTGLRRTGVGFPSRMLRASLRRQYLSVDSFIIPWHYIQAMFIMAMYWWSSVEIHRRVMADKLSNATTRWFISSKDQEKNKVSSSDPHMSKFSAQIRPPFNTHPMFCEFQQALGPSRLPLQYLPDQFQRSHHASKAKNDERHDCKAPKYLIQNSLLFSTR